MNRILKTILGILGRTGDTAGSDAVSRPASTRPKSTASGALPCPDVHGPGQPTCQEINAFLATYMDGELDPDTQRRFENHLELCPPCHGYFDQYRKTIDLAHACRDADLPPDLVKHTLTFLREHRSV